MSTISASTASNTAFKVTSDTTGTLVFQTGAVPTTAISIDASQVVSIGNIAVTGATTFAAGSAAAPSITTTGDTNTGIFFPAADTIAFTEGGVEAARIDSSGNLGIGTSSWPSGQRLRVAGGDVGLEGQFLYLVNANADIQMGAAQNAKITNTDSTNTLAIARTGASSIITFSTAGSERARITSGGFVGIGTTSPAIKLQVSDVDQATARIGVNNANGQNYQFVAGNPGASNTGFAIFDATASATRVYLDSSGNLGIGTTSPGALLHTYTATQESVRFARNSTASSAYVTFYANNSSSAQVQYAGILGDVASSTAGSHSGNLLFYTTGSGTSAERVRIDSSGNVGIGTSSPLGKLHAKGTAVADVVYRLEAVNNSYSSKLLISSTSSGDGGIRYGDSGGNLLDIFSYGDMRFFVGTANISGAVGNERARITSAGKMLVGTTSTSGTLTVDGVDAVSTGSVSTYAITCGNDAADALAFGSDASFAYVQSFGSRPLILNMQGNEIRVGSTTDQGAYNLQVNGTGVWGAGAYVNGSDARLKDNIQSLDSGLDVVKAMRPVTFQYKPEYNKDQSVQPGFIAQELQEAMAGKAYLDGVVHSGPEHLNVAYQNIIPILVKAIQELEAKFAALESK